MPENRIRLKLKRTSRGLLINVKTPIAVEECIKGFGTGTTDVRLHGRYWVSPYGKGPLTAYNIHGVDYKKVPPNLTELGKPMINDVGNPNLSFLRLVGTSAPDGVSFVCLGVFSSERIHVIGDLLKMELQRFYNTYMKPTEVNIDVVQGAPVEPDYGDEDNDEEGNSDD